MLKRNEVQNMAEKWQVIIQNDDKGTKFIYDKNVDKYKLIGLMEVEIDMLKKELIASMIKK